MEKKKYKIGYTQGTYDLFHIGHLNLIEHAKEQCEHLIVGINSDELVMKYKNKKANIPEKDRAQIVAALKAVDEVIVVQTLDKSAIYNLKHFDAIFIGDDWKGTDRWINTEEELSKFGVPVIYLPHTDGISTSEITQKIKNEG